MAGTPSPGDAIERSPDDVPFESTPDSLFMKQLEVAKEYLSCATFVVQSFENGKPPASADLIRLERQQYDALHLFRGVSSANSGSTSPWEKNYTAEKEWLNLSLEGIESIIQEHYKTAETKVTEMLNQFNKRGPFAWSVCSRCSKHLGLDYYLNKKIDIASEAEGIWERVSDISDFISLELLKMHGHQVYDYIRFCAAENMTSDALDATWVACHRSLRLPPTGVPHDMMANVVSAAKSEARTWARHRVSPDGLNLSQLYIEFIRTGCECPLASPETNAKRKEREEEESWRSAKKIKQEHESWRVWTAVTPESLLLQEGADIIGVKKEESKSQAHWRIRTSPKLPRHIKTDGVDIKTNVLIKEE